MDIKLGVIADDFTGATDAASFLIKGGNKTVLLTEVPDEFKYNCDCVVIALKIRSVSKEEAIKKVTKVLDFFDKSGIKQIYYKYCSTFDSTKEGNIGPIMDYLLERYDCRYSILCPALPINGREVKNGHLYVDGVPLDESPLKNHPLNPMWDSYIPNLMQEQSKYKAYAVSNESLKNGFYKKIISEINEDHFYLVPDYVNDKDGDLIADCFKELKVISGGSGLLEYLIKGYYHLDFKTRENSFEEKAIILCGSCSEMTSRQVSYFKNKGYIAKAIDAYSLLDREVTAEEVFKEVKNKLPKVTLIYSDGCEGKLDRENENFAKASKATEEFLASLSLMAKEDGFNRIIVAGGETSGAITLKLGYKGFDVGRSIAPGVPILRPLENENVILALKSGNFGNEDFFVKALEAN